MCNENHRKTGNYHYSVQKVVGKASLVKRVLETGRTHQIRVHMSHTKHSIVGDQVYRKTVVKVQNTLKSPDFIRSFNRQALHAYKLGLYHPRSREYMDFCSDLPQDMRTLINECEELTNDGNKKLLDNFRLYPYPSAEAIYLRNLCSRL